MRASRASLNMAVSIPATSRIVVINGAEPTPVNARRITPSCVPPACFLGVTRQKVDGVVDGDADANREHTNGHKLQMLLRITSMAPVATNGNRFGTIEMSPIRMER